MNNEKRKHRLLIDVTFSKPMNRRKAAKALQHFLDINADIGKAIYAYDNSPYIDKLRISERGIGIYDL